jgi:hypothetical protein
MMNTEVSFRNSGVSPSLHIFDLHWECYTDGTFSMSPSAFCFSLWLSAWQWIWAFTKASRLASSALVNPFKYQERIQDSGFRWILPVFRSHLLPPASFIFWILWFPDDFTRLKYQKWRIWNDEIVEGLKYWKRAGGSMKVRFPGHRKSFRNVSNPVRNG